jgi:hypothetical protein
MVLLPLGGVFVPLLRLLRGIRFLAVLGSFYFVDIDWILSRSGHNSCPIGDEMHLGTLCEKERIIGRKVRDFNSVITIIRDSTLSNRANAAQNTHRLAAKGGSSNHHA